MNINGLEKLLLENDCNAGSFLNGVRQPFQKVFV